MNIYLKARPVIVGFLLFVTLVFVNGNPVPIDTPPDKDFETRCGWLSNPTPGNFWLNDRDAEWTIGEQGGYQVDDWDFPEFKKGQWVRTNGNYGYGCACLQLQVNKEKHEVSKIKSAQALPLSKCRSDPALKKWQKLYK